ncbi:hypothetical protein NE237_013121 [Protea cynaroides]|uniref:Uncharacterized protein n=1 Tax=Protea cynaroides TaxID=273540 RepID=A0A9Q0GYQ5_9MAGN|nr:hypothetical protein NE237_013121 [Protea cynaroides]
MAWRGGGREIRKRDTSGVVYRFAYLTSPVVPFLLKAYPLPLTPLLPCSSCLREEEKPLLNIVHCNHFRRSSTSDNSRFCKFSAISISITFYPDFQIMLGLKRIEGLLSRLNGCVLLLVILRVAVGEALALRSGIQEALS